MARSRKLTAELRRAAITGHSFDVLYETYGLTMTINDVAELFQIARKTVWNRINRKQWPIPSQKVMGKWQMQTADVAAYIRATCAPTKPQQPWTRSES